MRTVLAGEATAPQPQAVGGATLATS
jgi:hypothetical protein